MQDRKNRSLEMLAEVIFFSRWLQAPLYLGLIIAQGVYVIHFMVELFHLLLNITTITGNTIMLSTLGLVDIVMIANLLVMVIIGGYQTFVSNLGKDNHPDRPEWLSHVNAGTMKIKLSIALITISSVHLLKTFVGIEEVSDRAAKWQLSIHITLVASALVMAFIDRLMYKPQKESQKEPEKTVA